jgi:hypothetical protein
VTVSETEFKISLSPSRFTPGAYTFKIANKASRFDYVDLDSAAELVQVRGDLGVPRSGQHAVRVRDPARVGGPQAVRVTSASPAVAVIGQATGTEAPEAGKMIADQGCDLAPWQDSNLRRTVSGSDTGDPVKDIACWTRMFGGISNANDQVDQKRRSARGK